MFNVTRTKTNSIFYIKQYKQVLCCAYKKKKREAEKQYNQINKQVNKLIFPS